MWFVARDDARRIVVFAGGDIVMQRKRRRGPSLMIFARDTDPDRIGGFGAGGRDALQEEVAELGEGGGFLAGNVALREEAKHLAERAVHAGGGGEIAACGIEFGKIEA